MLRVPMMPCSIQEQSLEEKLELTTAEIGLSVRTINCLDDEGIYTVRDLLNTTRYRLMHIPNFGEKSLAEIFRCLEPLGFVPGR